MSKLDRYKRNVCPPTKDRRPKGMKSVPIIGYELQQIYEQRLRMVDDLIAEAVRELREEKEYDVQKELKSDDEK